MNANATPFIPSSIVSSIIPCSDNKDQPQHSSKKRRARRRRRPGRSIKSTSHEAQHRHNNLQQNSSQQNRTTTKNQKQSNDEFLKLDGDTFPTLTTTTPIVVTSTSLVGSSTSLWNDESLANKLTISLELETRQRIKQQQTKLQQEKERGIDQAAKLTILSSSNKAMHLNQEIANGDQHDQVDAKINNSSMIESEEIREVIPRAISSSTDNILPYTIPNTKLKWTQGELSKMRARWWEAVRTKRKEAEEERIQRIQRQEALLTNNLNNRESNQSTVHCLDGGDNEEMYSSIFSNSSSSSSSISSESNTEEDDMEPPSLTRSMANNNIPRFAPISLPNTNNITAGDFKDSVSQSILDLEQKCLLPNGILPGKNARETTIEEAYPLHCAIYNYALCQDNDINNSNEGLFNNRYGYDNNNSEKSDAEIVLQRLLTMQHSDDVMQWRCLRIGLSDMRGLESDGVTYDESKVETLTNANVDVLSADVKTSLSPLQFAIYWDLPKIIRILCTTNDTSLQPSSSKHSDDEVGMTPLMLACELGHVACIQTLMCASCPKKLDRREIVGGNTAFHFCCMGPNYTKLLSVSEVIDEEEEHDDIFDCSNDIPVSACADAFDMLLRYTSIKDQKRALLLTNFNGQNLLHIACIRGDIPLLERLLDCHNLSGGKLVKALETKDKLGHTPFVSAVSHEKTKIIMHFITYKNSLSIWLEGCPLIVAASNRSITMIKLLLEFGYSTFTPGLPVLGEVKRALLEVIYSDGEDKSNHSDDAIEIIQLLIQEGGANPHMPTKIHYSGKPNTDGDRYIASHELKDTLEDTPLVAAVRAANTEAIRCMMSTYSNSLREAKQQRRSDPVLKSQPESYFRVLEEKEDDIVNTSIDTALVVSLFFLWKTGHASYGSCALILYDLSTPHKLSQQSMQWLERCISMGKLLPNLPKSASILECPMSPVRYSKQDIPQSKSSKATIDQNKKSVLPRRSSSLLWDSVELPFIQHNIPALSENRVLDTLYQNDVQPDMKWSMVLTGLPWFQSRANTLNCSWMQRIMSDSSSSNDVDYSSVVADDKFYLLVGGEIGGERLLAHKSIVSEKCGKLAAQIHFTESLQEISDDGDYLTVQIDLPLLEAKMLLSHCYHGSIAFGLKRAPIEQCSQLLELALVAEEYICPSLLAECELRLLEKSYTGVCICHRCISGIILSNALITPDSGLDILAVAQQLEQSSCCSVGTPFVAAKTIAIYTMLRNFPAVLKSYSYLRQIKDCSEEDDIDTSFTTQASRDESAILLLQTCLEGLACSLFNKK